MREGKTRGILVALAGMPLISVAAGAACCVLGALTMAAWHAHAASLLILTLGSGPMRYNSALLFLLCGVALIANAFRKQTMTVLCAALTGAIAAATAFEFLLGASFGIDDLLFDQYSLAGQKLDPRMAPNTAAAFLAASAALILLNCPSKRKIWPLVTALLASATLVLGVVAAVGYAAALEAAYAWGEFTGMSLVAAAGLMLLGSGILSATWRRSRAEGAEIPTSVPVPLGLLLASTTVLLWRSLLHNGGARGELLPAMVLAAGLVMALLTAIAVRLAQVTASKNHELRALGERLEGQQYYTRSLIEASLDPLVTISRQGTITDVNRATETATGVGREQLIGSDFCDYFSEPDKARAGYQQGFAAGFVQEYPLAIRHTSGRTTDVLYNASVFRNQNGEVEGVFAAARDVTKRKQAEEKLQHLAAIVESSDDAIYAKDLDGRIVSWNRGAERIYGYAAEEIIGQPVTLLIAPEQVNEVEKILACIRRGEAVEHYETVRLRKNGTPCEVSVTISPLHDPDGQITGASSIARDISGRKQAEAALAASEERYRSLVVATAQIVWMTDADGEVTTDMPMWRAFTGQTAEQIQGWGWIESLPREDCERVTEAWRHAVSTRSQYEVEYRMRRRDGEYRDMCVRGVPVLEADGLTIREWVGTCTDITERKRAEELLREKAALLELAPVAVVVRDFDSRIKYWSHGAEQLYGWSEEEALGRVTHELLHTAFPKPVSQIEAEVMSGARWEGELVHTARNGKQLTMMSRWAPQRDESGRMRGYLEINADITRRKQAEEERERYLQELERSNAELQDFASIASHDLQEPLRKVQAFGEHLKEHLGENLDELGKDFLARMQNAAQRMSGLIEALLQYSRVTSKAQPFQPVDLQQAVCEVLVNMEESIATAHARVEFVPMPRVMADPVQVRQLLQNLVGNALKFQRPGNPPRVSIEAHCVGAAALGCPGDQGGWEITVRDNGIGFDEKYLDRIFRPFQRLHGRNEYAGSGMGLAICRKVVARHGGTITAHSRPGEGSQFVVTLPSTPVESQERRQAWQAEPETMAS